jgi:acetyl esterase/lipase
MGGVQPDLGLFPDIQSLRDWITNAKKAMSAEMGGKFEGVDEHDEQVTMRDGAKIICRIHRPEKAPAGGSPLAVLYHGGGWCIGGLENEELLCRLLASKLGCVCVNVDYRLAPEHKFPTPVLDCHDATKWVRSIPVQVSSKNDRLILISSTGSCERLLPRCRPK